MGAILYYDDCLCIFEADTRESRPIEDEVFALLDLDATDKAASLDFLQVYHNRYTHGVSAVLPGADLGAMDATAIEDLGLHASQLDNAVSISYDWLDADGNRVKEPALVSVGKWEFDKVQEATRLVKLVSYLLLFGEGKISPQHFKQRCADNGIDFSVSDSDGVTTFSVNVPVRYFASRDENASDLLTFEDDRAIVQANKLFMYDLGLWEYPKGAELERIAATVLVEKLANESSSKPFWIDPLQRKIRRHEHTSLIAAVVDMCHAERIAPCPICGRLVARPKDSSSRFNCGVKGHQARYNDKARNRLVRSGIGKDQLKKEFPYLKEDTLAGWYDALRNGLTL